MNNLPYFISKDQSFILYHGNSLDLFNYVAKSSIDLIFADPPYHLSNSGITCVGGEMKSVNKGNWDASSGLINDYMFDLEWINKSKELLKDTGTIWISGTKHNIYMVGYILQQLELNILNNITWQKTSPPPNLSCKTFTHSTETILWAAKSKKYTFNYKDMKAANNNKQMKDVWQIGRPTKQEIKYGKHPTQKPEALLERIILAGSNKGDTILDPFNGSGTTGIVAHRLGRGYVGFEMDEKYLKLAIKRLEGEFLNVI